MEFDFGTRLIVSVIFVTVDFLIGFGLAWDVIKDNSEHGVVWYPSKRLDTKLQNTGIITRKKRLPKYFKPTQCTVDVEEAMKQGKDVWLLHYIISGDSQHRADILLQNNNSWKVYQLFDHSTILCCIRVTTVLRLLHQR